MVLDKALEGGTIYCHPMFNEKTVKLSWSDFDKFMTKFGITPRVVDFDGEADTKGGAAKGGAKGAAKGAKGGKAEDKKPTRRGARRREEPKARQRVRKGARQR